jgi:hypothetical protein
LAANITTEEAPMLERNYFFAHLPKTAGSTLKAAFEATVAKDDIVWDYQRPFGRSYISRNIISAIDSFSTRRIKGKLVYGHFLPCKYCDLRLNGYNKRIGSVYLTFLREPLQRAVSHYYFWKRTPDIENYAYIKFKEENWNLERFLTDRYYRNFYAQYFFGFGIKNFDFIGITERYEDSIKLLRKLYPEFATLSFEHKLNFNSTKQIGENYEIDPKLASIFIKNNVLDYKIYEMGKAFLNDKYRLYQL